MLRRLLRWFLGTNPPSIADEMCTVEVRYTVPGYSRLTESLNQRLMESFEPLSPNLQMRLWGRVQTSPDSIVVELEGAAILVTHLWEVTVWGASPEHCWASLFAYHQLASRTLDVQMEGTLRVPNAVAGSLQDLVGRVEQTRSNRQLRGSLVLLAISVAATVVAGMAVTLLLGG